MPFDWDSQFPIESVAAQKTSFVTLFESYLFGEAETRYLTS